MSKGVINRIWVENTADKSRLDIVGRAEKFSSISIMAGIKER